jgi:hypothetical protein
MFDLKLYWLYGLIFKRRFVISLAFLLFVIVGLVCWRLTGIVFIN